MENSDILTREWIPYDAMGDYSGLFAAMKGEDAPCEDQDRDRRTDSDDRN